MPEIRESIVSRTLGLEVTPTAELVQHQVLDPSLRQILLDALTASSIFNNVLPDRAFDLITFQEMQVSICYRLFRLNSLQSPRPECDVQAVYHMGLTIFMITLFFQFDCRRMLGYELISLRFKEALSNEFDGGDQSGLALWLALIGGIWLSGDVDPDSYRDWLGLRLRREAQQLGVHNWDEALDAVKRFPWIHTLHDEPGRIAWNQAHDSVMT